MRMLASDFRATHDDAPTGETSAVEASALETVEVDSAGSRTAALVVVSPALALDGEWAGSLIGRTVDCHGFHLDLDERLARFLGLGSAEIPRLTRSTLGLASDTDARPHERLAQQFEAARVAVADAIEHATTARKAHDAFINERANAEALRDGVNRDIDAARAELAGCERQRGTIFERHIDAAAGVDRDNREHADADAELRTATASAEEIETALGELRARRAELLERSEVASVRVDGSASIRAKELEANETGDAMACRQAEIEAALAHIHAQDPTPVRSALEQLDAVCSRRGGTRDPIARELIDAWDALEARRAARPELDAEIAATEAAVAAATDRIALLSASVGPEGPSDDDHQQIERIHRERLEAAAAAQGRRVSEEMLIRVRDTEHGEQVLLARHGYASYAEYLIASTVRGAHVHADPALRGARADLAAAQTRTIDARARVDAWVASLATAESELRFRIADHVGVAPEGDLITELHVERLVPQPSPELLFGLEVALADVGIEQAHSDPIGLAREWLGQHGEADDQRRVLEHELLLVANQRDESSARLLAIDHELRALHTLESEIEHLDSAVEAAEQQIAVLETKSEALDTILSNAKARFAEADQALADSMAALAAIDRELSAAAQAVDGGRRHAEEAFGARRDLDMKFADAEATEARLQANVAAAESVVSSCQLACDQAAIAKADVHSNPVAPLGPDAISDLRAQLREFLTSLPTGRWAGPVPLVVEDAFGGLADTDAELLFADVVDWVDPLDGQIIYIADDPLARATARS